MPTMTPFADYMTVPGFLCPFLAEPIFTKFSRKMAIEKLGFWFLNSFTGCEGNSIDQFGFGPSFTKRNIVTKQIYVSRKESCLILVR